MGIVNQQVPERMIYLIKKSGLIITEVVMPEFATGLEKLSRGLRYFVEDHDGNRFIVTIWQKEPVGE